MPFQGTESRRDWSKRYRDEHTSDVDTTKTRWQEANQEKRKVHILVNNAIRDGKIERGPCEYENGDCTPEPCTVQAHHEDYSKPLTTRWLCPWHHKQVDLGKME